MFFGNKKCRIYAACGVSQTPNYIVSIEGKEINMAYQFCVDEKYLYLLDNTTKRYRDGMIYRVDETGEPVKLRCRVKREDHKNRIHSEIID